ncbi:MULTISPECIES: peptide MFS transporter [Micrococcaceae]|uniref:peptide MFS transporter n=1 Tax=Micrococcaceae TaxID=1268 RepID=UPI001622E30F|nr:peptide MFS transporter [Citricoccus sp.]MBB5749223.1 POT family proton-dependent oligopeptide transporter [Micrococcus sp. TA1]HRO29422.1 peptide MFS transporter [Citricoccus sp.]HRO93041.1 peptide MFS transporter [Citricoccus sp.]
MHSPETIEPTAAERNPSGRTFFGQPGPLANLFSVELWERFSFYGMQGILLIYMYFTVAEGGLGIDEAVATGIVGAYGGMVYVFCIIGGWVADRLLGSERTMFISGVLIMCGHIALALVPGVPGLALGLVLVGLGSGGLKANVANLVGNLYTRADPRRDAGFSIFYMGINIGGLVGPLLTGWTAQTWGFHVGFGLAAVGMAIGLTQYALTRKSLPEHVHHVPSPLPRSQYGRWIGITVVALAVIAVAVATGLVNAANLADVVVVLSVVAAIAIFAVILTSAKTTGEERSRVLAFIPLFIGSAAFFALFQQQFTVITLYSDTRLDRMLGDWEMPIPWVQSFNPFFIILLAPVFAALWTKLGRRQPNTPVKFGVGIALMGAAFLLFLPMVGTGAVPVLWIGFIMLVATMGELMVSPVGLSLSTKLAPAAFPVMMVALYNLSVALGTALSGALAGYYTAETEGTYFGILGAVTIAIGVVMLVISRPVHRAMRGVH